MKTPIIFILLIFANSLLAAVDPKSCLECHTTDTLTVPTISGQSQAYLEKQLYDFKFKNRVQGQMNKIAAGLTDSEIRMIASYFSQTKWQDAEADLVTNKNEIEKGRILAEQVSCATCHGDNLQGILKAPRLANQKFLYLQKQLHDFKRQQRTNDLGQMAVFTQMLTDDDIKNLALYLESVNYVGF